MKVACAHQAMSGLFRPFFPDLTVLGSNRFPSDLNLLILTGGSDINPARYGEKVAGSVGIDNNRDEIEHSHITSARMRNVKVLGVCRGFQLLNIEFGGSLVQDMYMNKMEHRAAHSLTWADGVLIPQILMTNSMHHQAVTSSRCSATRVLATEPDTKVIEEAMWGDQCLGVQWHPEFFMPDKAHEFFNFIKEWVEGKVNIVETKPRPEPKLDIGNDALRKKLRYESLFANRSESVFGQARLLTKGDE